MTDPAETIASFSPSRLRLWQLISPALPIGAFAYSQGQEYAVEAGWLNDEDSAREWILSYMENVLAVTEVPVLLRCYRAARARDWPEWQHWNRLLLAMRESAELRDEDLQVGQTLRRVLEGQAVPWPEALREEAAYAPVFALACAHWDIPEHEAAAGFLWAWCENQVAAAIKLVPLGQTSGQRILSAAVERLPDAVRQASQCSDEDVGMLAPGLAMASALHETQYSRLFRS